MSALREMRIFSIMYDLSAKSPVVILKEEDGDRYLMILIGVPEAGAIESGIKKKRVSRPMTHDLITSILREMAVTVSQVQINKIEDHTFYANILIDDDGSTLEIDARPSDAIAIALREEAPIMVHEDILNDAGVQLPHPPVDPGEYTDQYAAFSPEEPTDFKEFIAKIRPEDLFPADEPEADDD
ncbi:MAG: bifunctional nuclease family protein [bacterium]